MREIMGYIDVAQVTIWLFWLFFAGLVSICAARTGARATRSNPTPIPASSCRQA